MIKRRSIEVFSLSFLDCLCCGFGAILLLFLLSIGTGPHGVKSEVDSKELQALRETLETLEANIREKISQLESALTSQQNNEERSRVESRIQELKSQLADLQQEYTIRQSNLSTSQREAAEAERLLKSFEYENLPPIGLPAEATHVAFIIDTSGSMRNQFTKLLHSAVIEQIRDLLESLPKVQSIQFIDTSGNYMLFGKGGYWLPDTSGLRNQALTQLRAYPFLSESDPEDGVRRAMRDLKPSVKPGEKMSLYIIGDDLHGSTKAVLSDLDRMNPRDPATGKRKVSISGVGFPTIGNPFQIGVPQGNANFANIMREIAEAHDGVLILNPRL